MTPKDVVLRKEGEGKGLYQQFSTQAGIPALAQIFAMLSQDEERHVDALRALQQTGKVDLPRSTTLDGINPLLRRLAMQEPPSSALHGDPHSWMAAMDFEADSARVCAQLAREASHGWERELFQKIAEEDEIHFTLLEQLRELLAPSCGKETGGGCDVH